MLEDLRRAPFVAAVACVAAAWAAEAGTGAMTAFTRDAEAPGIGVGALALLDLLLVTAVGLMAASLVVAHRIYGRVHAFVSFFVALTVIAASFGLFLRAVGELFLMVGLLMSAFGTPIYFARYARFDVGSAAIFLTLAMTLKQAACVLLVVANQRFLRAKSLVLMLLTSMLATFLVSFLHGFPPGFAVSITDALAAIVVAVLSAIWAVVTLVGSIVGMVKAVKSLA